jgi:hypothetical protein
MILERLEKEPEPAMEVGESKVLVPPTDKKAPKKSNKHEFYKVLDVALDCDLKIAKGKVVLVDNSMVEEITGPKGETYLFILENYVLGFFLEGAR